MSGFSRTHDRGAEIQGPARAGHYLRVQYALEAAVVMYVQSRHQLTVVGRPCRALQDAGRDAKRMSTAARVRRSGGDHFNERPTENANTLSASSRW
jgi:hypothetical protein